MLLYGPELDNGGTDLVIGLVNCMPAKAVRRTEAQFANLLQDASAGLRVRLRFFAPDPIQQPHYEGLAALWPCQLDGVIVTGAEPQATAVEDEPLWPTLAALVDWASACTSSAVWSCMSGQAAVLRLSGLQRQPMPAKLSGIYECEAVTDHPLMAGAPDRWPVPHSRYNDLPVAVLTAAGYEVLSRGRGLSGCGMSQYGADSFVKQAGRSLFLILQGHPEYGGDSLLLEYRRDIRRVLLGQRHEWPALPANYLDADTGAAMTQLRKAMINLSPAEAVEAFDARIATIPLPRWQQQGTNLFANWLAGLAAEQAAPAQQLAAAVL